MENLDSYYKTVEECVASFGVDPVKSRGERAGQWNLQRGSANVWIDIFYVEQAQQAYFQVMAPVVPMPTTDVEKFYEELLETNFTLYGVAFAKYQGAIYIKVVREAKGLDVAEAQAMVGRVGVYADHYDDELIKKYNIQVQK